MVTRPTIMEIDMDALKYNIQSIQKYIGNKMMMPVIKANGYGTYINTRLDVINMFDIVAVALVDEAVELRRIGYNKEIFILNQPSIDEIDKIVSNNITVGVCSIDFLNAIKDNKIKVHVEIDSGMGRTGIRLNEINNFIEVLDNSNVEVEGIYTHLSSADYDPEYTKKQFEIFDKAVNILKEKYNLKYIHACASNGLLNYKDNDYNLVRPGIILYGYESSSDTFNKIDLKPISKLKSKVTFIKEVDENTSIGYSRKYITTKRTKIATIPIGYADGLSRLLFSKGNVVIKNKLYPIVGNICMDSIMVDVGNDDINTSDEVYIWDNDLIKLEDLSNAIGTINYEVISTISSRVPRIFK